MAESNAIGELNIVSNLGLDGKTLNGLHVHPDGIHILYPFGNCVTIQNFKTKRQSFLRGHNNLVSAVALSNDGKYVASGQVNHIGFKAVVILWDFEKRERVGGYELHHVRVASIAFSHEDRFIMSLGDRDDTRVLVYDMKIRQPIGGEVSNGANTGIASIIAPSRTNASSFFTAGDRTLRLWKTDTANRKLTFIEVNFNKVKRVITCLTVDSNDEFMYCGTSSGDIVKVSLGGLIDEEGGAMRPPVVIGVFGKRIERNKRTMAPVDLYGQGVRAILVLEKGKLVIGAGDGEVEIVQEVDKVPSDVHLSRKVKEPTVPKLKKIKNHNVDSGVSSMRMKGDHLLIATVESEIYSIGLDKWDLQLLSTCHTSAIYDVCFPKDMSTVFATASKGSIRVWNSQTNQELLRIQVANIICTAIQFQHNGRGIVSSWNDGKIRAFTPQTGQLKYLIHKAHNRGVSALAITNDDKTLVSGGGEGQVRLWDIKPTSQTLRAILQEHKGPVSAIRINSAGDEAASASTDGSCIIWDILRHVRKNIIFAKTLFMAACFHVSDFQVLTVGTDRKISYWETFDGSLIQEIEGSTSAINSVDVSPCGNYFVTGGNDSLIKLWKYLEGEVMYMGVGHAAVITQARYSPDGRIIVSVSSDGTIFQWRNPYHTEESTPNLDREAKYIETIRSEPGNNAASAKSRKESIQEVHEMLKTSNKLSRARNMIDKDLCQCPPCTPTSTAEADNLPNVDCLLIGEK